MYSEGYFYKYFKALCNNSKLLEQYTSPQCMTVLFSPPEAGALLRQKVLWDLNPGLCRALQCDMRVWSELALFHCETQGVSALPRLFVVKFVLWFAK